MAQSQNKGLSEHQRRASWLRTGPSAHWRQRGRRATTRAGRWGAISTPEMASSNKLWAGSQLPTKSSSNPGWLTSAGRVTVRDQLPRGDTRHTWDGFLAAHPGNPLAGTQEVIRCTAPPEESTLAKHLVAWAAQTWEGHKTQAQLSLCLCGEPKNPNLSSLELGSTQNPGPTLDSSPAEQPGAWAV